MKPQANIKVTERKVALVTGAGRGLGAALCYHLAAWGYAVAVHYRTSASGAADVAEGIVASGGEAIALNADLSKPPEVSDMTAEVLRHWGRLDLLINNAGIYRPVPLVELSYPDWLEGFQSTATATFLMTQTALPALRRSGRGRIINIGDSSADRATSRDLALGYHLGKTGVWMMTRSYARAEAPHGITVNMISPGYLENSIGLVEEESIPAGRLGTFGDVWTAVKFLVGEEAGYITGTNILVSGGWNLR